MSESDRRPKKMADTANRNGQGQGQAQGNMISQAVTLVHDIATGRHFLSRLVPGLLWLFDAALCWVIIKKIPCKKHAGMEIGLC